MLFFNCNSYKEKSDTLERKRVRLRIVSVCVCVCCVCKTGFKGHIGPKVQEKYKSQQRN